MSNNIDLLAEILFKNGIKYVTGIIGGGKSIKLVNKLESKGIKFVHTHHEASGAIIAGAINRSSKIKAASISIKGPGFINMLVGISHNHFERIKSISISEDYSYPKDNHKFHKRINQVELIKEFTKDIFSMGYIIKKEKEFSESLESKYSIPIHINLSDNSYKISNQTKKLKYKEQNINNIKKEIKNHHKPVIILGSELLKNFLPKILKLKIPIFSTVSGLGLIKSETPFYAGIFTGEGKNKSIEKSIISESDLIILLGVYGNEITGEIKGNIISLDIFSENIENNIYQKTQFLEDKKINEILYSLKQNWGEDSIISAKKIEKNYLLNQKWSPATCFELIDKNLKKFNLVLDTGNFAIIAEHVFNINYFKDRKYFGSSNGRFMGTSIPTAIGVSIANPKMPTICIFGDGGISPYFSDIKIISEKNLPILLLFISDGGYGSIAKSAPKNSIQEAIYFENPSWYSLIKEFNISSYQCKNKEEFKDIYLKWNLKTPIFIECLFDKNKYIEMTSEIR